MRIQFQLTDQSEQPEGEQAILQDLDSMMRYWIENEQCIPGFLASVTLECWEGVKRRRDRDVEMVER